MRSLRFVVAIGALLVAATTSADDAALWQAGIASRVVTPAESMWMAGYASRDKPSEGKIHDLYVKALALKSPDGGEAVLITSDLISIQFPVRDALVEAVGKMHGLEPHQILINCSHTHCGPEIRTTRWSLDGLPPERLDQSKRYVEFLNRQLLELVDAALADRQPAKVSYTHARCGFAMNRRTPTATGYRNFPNPDGPVDHDVPVLRVDSPDGKLRAVLFGYACHNTTLGIYQFCGDYAGFAQQYLEEAHPGATALFVLGCGGDQNPYPRRTVELAEQHGRTLANAVETALETNAKPLKGPLKTALGRATLEYQTPPTREQLEKQAASSDKYDSQHAQRLLAYLDSEGSLRTTYDAPIQVMHLGDQVTLVGLPGETVVDYSLRLKAELGSLDGTGPAIWIAGYCNDVFAYIPSRRVLLEGGYEAGDAMRYFTTVLQPGPFAPNVEERIIEKVHELHDSLAR
jgi:neutral ceramidase